MRGEAFLNGKEGRVGFRKTPFLTLKKDGMILEKMAGEVPEAYFISYFSAPGMVPASL